LKTEEIKQLFEQFEAVASTVESIECWSAREMQILLGYSKWENFEKVIQKAKNACNNAGETDSNHFPDVRKTIPMPKGAEKEIDDILLTRYACYLIAQNPIEKEHIDNNLAVRKMLVQRGIIPENLPSAEDVKKVQRKLESEDKRILKNTKKKQN